MQLGKVKLKSGGTKGLEIGYLEKVKRDGFTYYDEHKSVRINTPVPAELKVEFSKLVVAFLDVTGLDTDQVTVDMVKVTGVESNEGDFTILADVTGPFGTLKVEHDVISKESGYSQYKKVMKIIEKIYDLTQGYISNQLHQNAQQMLLEFSKDEKVSEKYMQGVELEMLTEVEQVEKAREILEKMGMIVLGADDFEGAAVPAMAVAQ